MGSVYINGSRVNFIGISDIVDSLSPNSASFTVELLNYSTSHRLGQSVEVYGYSNNLLAVGNVRNESVKIATRSRSSLEVVGYSSFLNWQPITGRFSGTLQDVITLLISSAGMAEILLGARFLTSDEAKTAEINISFSYQFLHQCLEQVLALSGYPLTYRIPISEKIIEINQPNYGNPAPIADLNLDSLYSACGLGIVRPITYKVIPPIASKIRVYGHNGLTSLGDGSTIPLDTVAYISLGETQFSTLKTADEIIKVLITVPEGCSLTDSVTSSNVGINFPPGYYFFFDYFLPQSFGSDSEWIYTANIDQVKESSNFSIYWDAEPDVDQGHLTVTFEGVTLFDEDIDDTYYATTTVVSLAAYAGQSGELVATFTLASQSGGVGSNSYYAFQANADCCCIDTVIGSGPTGIGNGSSNGDGLTPLTTLLSSPSGVAVHPTTQEIYFTDQDTSVDGGYRVRKLNSSSNMIEAVGGNGQSSGTGTTNGVDATTLDFGEVTDIVFYNDNGEIKLFVNLQDYPEVGYIDANGLYYQVITTTDFSSLALGTLEPNAMTIDPTNGDIFLATGTTSLGKNYILKWDGSSLSVYGGIGSSGSSGDGGLATSARLHRPSGLACDSEGNLYIADSLNDRVRKITKSTGIISTVVGGGASDEFGSLATNFNLGLYAGNPASSIAINSSDNIYILGESSPGQILEIKADTGTIHRFLGVNTSLVATDFTGDGGALKTAGIAPFDLFPGRIAFFADGQMVFADAANQRIRRTYCGDLP